MYVAKSRIDNLAYNTNHVRGIVAGSIDLPNVADSVVTVGMLDDVNWMLTFQCRSAGSVDHSLSITGGISEVYNSIFELSARQTCHNLQCNNAMEGPINCGLDPINEIEQKNVADN